jgi:ABC-type sugar transport system substrate-binding protein
MWVVQDVRGRVVRAGIVGLVVCALGVIAAGCGDDGTAATSASSGTTTGANGAASAEAVRASTLAQTTLLYGPTTGPAKPSQLRAPKASDISAYPYKADGTKRKVAILACSPTAALCVHTAELTKEYLDKLGIASTTTMSDYTPAGDQRAMNTALSQKPDAIIFYGLQPLTMGPQLTKAKAAGIPVIDGLGSSATNEGNVDAHVPQGSSLYQIAVAAQMAVDGKGAGNIRWLDVANGPNLENKVGIQFLRDVCPGCTVSTGSETVDQVVDPVKVGQLVTSAVRAHPDLTYLTFASACMQLQAAAVAARQAGDVKVTAGGCGAAAISSMNAGQIPFATGSVEPWSALASIDQTMRLWDKQPPLPDEKTGPAAYAVTPDSTPDKSTKATPGPLDRWTVSRFDYVAPYSKAWGVDLSSVIASEK